MMGYIKSSNTVYMDNGQLAAKSLNLNRQERRSTNIIRDTYNLKLPFDYIKLTIC